MYGSGAVSCSYSLLIRGPILPAVRQKLHLSPCADSQSRLSSPHLQLVYPARLGLDRFERGSTEQRRSHLARGRRFVSLDVGQLSKSRITAVKKLACSQGSSQ